MAEIKQVDGVYVVGDKRIESRAKAEEYAKLLQEAEQALERPDLSDLVPENFTVRERSLIWRGSILEVPMNETHMPDGKTLNPFYDRTYLYAWASYTLSGDVAEKQAKGYELVSMADLKRLVKERKAPEHYLSLLREEGRYLVYGDLVLMRIPRVLYRQQQAEYEEMVQSMLKRRSAEQEEAFGSHKAPSPVKNELVISFS